VIEQAGHGTVTIGSIERYITETAWRNGWVKPVVPQAERAQSVGIIGAGPGGLAAAEQLRRLGYQVEVYDRYDRIGGLLVYGIPNFKLEKDVVARRAELLRAAGVSFHLNCEIGRDVAFEELRQRHDAVLVAIGVYQARDIKAPGVGLPGVLPALDYLIAANRKGLGDTVPAFDDGTLDAAGKNVVVIGGGDTAMDCLRTAVRQGASSVKCLYRRDRQNMPGSQREVGHAEEEGVEFVEDKLTAVRALRMHLGLPDATGRHSPQPIEGSNFTLEADMAIKALGFDPGDLSAIFGASELALTRWGTIKIDHRSMMSGLDGVFAAGDIVRGASLVVWAIRDGRDAAERIDRYIQAKLSVGAKPASRAVA
jgi:glutamate synthase (NADPH/NADH) small chain